MKHNQSGWLMLSAHCRSGSWDVCLVVSYNFTYCPRCCWLGKRNTQTGLGWISILCSGTPPKLKKHPLKSPQCEWVYHIIIHIISISYIYIYIIYIFRYFTIGMEQLPHIQQGSTFFWPLQLPQELVALYDKQVFVLRRIWIRPETSMIARKKPQATLLLLMAEILHQLRLVVFPIIYRVSYIPGGAGFQPSTVPSSQSFFCKAPFHSKL